MLAPRRCAACQQRLIQVLEVRGGEGTTVKGDADVVRVGGAADIDGAKAYLDVADWLMFDALPPKDMKNALPGGNAQPFEWRLMAGRAIPKPWQLAGGLTPGNVAEAIRSTGATLIDVSSGVEDRPGVKSPEKIRRFLAAARSV